MDQNQYPMMATDFLASVSGLKKPKLVKNKKMYVLRTENLYEVIYAIIGELFLRQGDIVAALARELKRRFGKGYYQRYFGGNTRIMDKSAVSLASKSDTRLNMEVNRSPEYKGQDQANKASLYFVQNKFERQQIKHDDP